MSTKEPQVTKPNFDDADFNRNQLSMVMAEVSDGLDAIDCFEFTALSAYDIALVNKIRNDLIRARGTLRELELKFEGVPMGLAGGTVLISYPRHPGSTRKVLTETTEVRMQGKLIWKTFPDYPDIRAWVVDGYEKIST